jgi:mRNA-degrading endonuclease RelE of RelBE toxin-antitoxin system
VTARPLQFSSSAQKFIVSLYPLLQTRIENALLEIAANPRAGKPLKGDLKGNHAQRVGDWRIVYSIEKTAIYVKDIRHRREVYRRK